MGKAHRRRTHSGDDAKKYWMQKNDEMKVALPRAASVLIGLDGWMCDTDTYLASERSLKTLCSVQVFMYFFYNKPSFRETVGIWIVSVREAFKTNFR